MGSAACEAIMIEGRPYIPLSEVRRCMISWQSVTGVKRCQRRWVGRTDWAQQGISCLREAGQAHTGAAAWHALDGLISLWLQAGRFIAAGLHADNVMSGAVERLVIAEARADGGCRARCGGSLSTRRQWFVLADYPEPED